MQTTFTLAQLADPNTAEAEKILRTCVHCGFCTATCPTYVLLGDELDSPRGRIYLIKEMLEQGRPAGPTEVKHLDRCLSCLSCMTTCPSGVHYMHLVDHARDHIERTFERPLAERWLRRILSIVIPRPHLFRLALAGASLAKAVGAQYWLPRRLAAMVSLARIPATPRATDEPGVFAALGQRRGRVAMLAGCAQPVLRPEINAAAIRLLGRLGIEVVVAEGAGCCGALTHHMGLEEPALRSAKANIAAWHREIETGGLEAILVTTSGCGTTVKDYGYLFRNDPVWRERARAVSERALDITEYLARLGLPAAPRAAEMPMADMRVAYHAACSLQHGQKVTEAPKQLLRDAGFTVLTVPEGHLCCGSAGTYNMLQPELSQALRDRKAANINGQSPDLVATGNIGCMQQLEDAIGVPIVHTVELLDWAHGGPKPGRLSKR